MNGYLGPLDGSGNPLVRVLQPEAPTCPATCLGPPDHVIGLVQNSEAIVVAGSINVSGGGDSASTTLSGSLSFAGGNCVEGTCPFVLQSLHFEGSDFSFAGESIVRPSIMNSTPGLGTFIAPSVFLIPVHGLEVFASGTIDATGRKGARFSASSPGFGLISQSSRLLLFTQTFSSDGITVDIHVTAAVNNLAPTVALSPMEPVECTGAGGALVSVPAVIHDADGSVQTSQWYLDGALVDVNVSALSTFVPLGTHVIQVWVFDEDGAAATASTSITVEDTTAPGIAIDTVCLWPPNHKLFVVRAEDVPLNDACDPSAHFEFVSAASDQADDAMGDGHTTDDVIVHPHSLCVRAERSGSNPAGRTYSVVGRVADSSGNSTDVTFTVSIPHDLGDGCDLLASESLVARDLACFESLSSYDSFESPDPTSVPSDDMGNSEGVGGCSSQRSGNGLVVLGILALLLLRRRRGG